MTKIPRQTYTLVVDNLDNRGELAGVGTAADEHQTANLNKPPRGDLNIDIGHGEGLPVSRNSGSVNVGAENRTGGTHGRQTPRGRW